MPHPNSEELEKMIHRTLQSLPDRRAPHTLEARVLAAIEARQALPWWQQSFNHWPVAARGAFLCLTGILAATLIALVFRTEPHVEADAISAISGLTAMFNQINAGIHGISNFGLMVFRSIPPLWIYGGIAFIAAMYAALFGLSATAYRAFINQR